MSKKSKILKNLFFFFIVLNTTKVVIIQDWLSGLQNDLIVLASFAISFLFFHCIYSALYLRKTKWWFCIFYILQIIYYIVHIAYYDFYRNPLNIFQTIFLLKEGIDVLLVGAVPLHPVMLFLFLDFFLFVFLIVDFKNKSKFISNKSKSLAISSLILYIVTMISLILFDLPYKVKKIRKEERRVLLKNQHVIALYGMFYHNIIATMHYSFKEKDRIAQISYGKYQEKSFVPLPEKEKPSFLFLQIESLQSMMIHYRYKDQLVMPYLANLVKHKEVVYFPYTLAYHDGGGSSDTEWSIMNNIESFLNFPGIILANYNYTNSFIQSFKNNHYLTYAFHNNYSKYFNRNKAYNKMGFDKFIDVYQMPYPEKLKPKWGIDDGPMFNYIFEYIQKTPEPFLFYIINMTTHSPYNFLDGIYKNDFYKGSKNYNFLNSFSYVDLELKKFIENIKSLNKKIYLVLYGDHTCKTLPNMKRPMVKIKEAKMEFVPLVIAPLFEVKAKNNPLKTSTSNIIVSFHDIAPTVLELAQLSYGYCFFGNNLLDENLSDEIYFKGKIFSRTNLYRQITTLFPLSTNQ